MERKKYYHSNHSLRKLLYAFNEEDMFERKFEYRFGLILNPSYDLYDLYDVVPDHIIGTIKLSDNTVIRYRPNTPWRYQLGNLVVDDKPTIMVPSDNLDRHLDFARSSLRNRLRREVRTYQTFLDQENRTSEATAINSLSNYTVHTFHMMAPLQPLTYQTSESGDTFGSVMEQVTEISVRVVIPVDCPQEITYEAQHMIERLTREGVRYGNDPIPIEVIQRDFDSMVRSRWSDTGARPERMQVTSNDSFFLSRHDYTALAEEVAATRINNLEREYNVSSAINYGAMTNYFEDLDDDDI